MATHKLNSVPIGVVHANVVPGVYEGRISYAEALSNGPSVHITTKPRDPALTPAATVGFPNIGPKSKSGWSVKYMYTLLGSGESKAPSAFGVGPCGMHFASGNVGVTVEMFTLPRNSDGPGKLHHELASVCWNVTQIPASSVDMGGVMSGIATS